MKNNIFTIIINDEFCNNAEITSSNVSINFGSDNKGKAESEFVEAIDKYKRTHDNYYDEVGIYFIIKEVNLYEIVKKVIKRNYKDFISKNIKLQLEEFEETVYCDTKWIEFILNQIIVNSIKYLKEKIRSVFSYRNESSHLIFIYDFFILYPPDNHRI